MGKYSNWVKKAEAPDIEDFYAFSEDKQKKAVKNVLYCLFMFALQVVSGLMDSSSSHSFLVFYPYVFIFLPLAFLLFASVRLFLLPSSISKKQWDKSLGSLKHSDIGLILASGLCTVCEIVFFCTHLSVLKDSPSLKIELTFGILQIILFAASVMYGFFYDKNFSGK